MLKYIKQAVLILNGPDLKSKSKLFYWLASWMKHTKLDLDASSTKLIKEAYESFE